MAGHERLEPIGEGPSVAQPGQRVTFRAPGQHGDLMQPVTAGLRVRHQQREQRPGIGAEAPVVADGDDEHGFADTRVVPDVIALRAYYPGMLAAAACGRRP